MRLLGERWLWAVDSGPSRSPKPKAQSRRVSLHRDAFLTPFERIFRQWQQAGIFAGARVERIVVAVIVEQAAKLLFTIRVRLLLVVWFLLLTGMLVHAPSSGKF